MSNANIIYSVSSIARKATGKSPFAGSAQLSAETRRLVQAAERAPIFLVKGNMPSDFHLKDGHEVDPGSMAYSGKDAKGNDIWADDQTVRVTKSPPDLSKCLLDGFFSGAIKGRKGDGPTVRLLAVKREGSWKEASGMNPFKDPAVTQFIMKYEDMHPVPGLGKLLPEGSFSLFVDKSSVIRNANQCEFTAHFLNPDKLQEPVPGKTDGAIRYRIIKNADGSASMENYYVTRAAARYLDTIKEFAPPVKTLATLFSIGHAFYKLTPVGLLTAPLSDRVAQAAESAFNKTLGATDAIRLSVSALHSRYFRKIVVPNLLGG